jgi:hypothetical protein
MPESTTPRPPFDWRVYADATCAGLTPLVPIPLLDLALERYFRRRMPSAIARARREELLRLAELRLGSRPTGAGPLAGCLALPILLARYVVTRLWRKIVYIFAVTDAVGQVSAYWQRAFLLDHLIRAGHLAPGTDTRRAIEVFNRVLRDADPSPLRGLARLVVSSSGRTLRLLVRARRRGAAAQTESLGEILRSNWRTVEASLRALAVDYNRRYASWPDEPPAFPTAREGAT